MKKIGILTFWNVPNYGTFLQAYALQKVLEKKYPSYDVRQIPYLNSKHYKIYYSNSITQNYRYWFINPKFYINMLSKKHIKRDLSTIKKFIEYYKLIPHFTGITKTNIRALSLDILILGSDIIWDYTVPFFGNDQYLFGLGLKAKKKLSYAASFCSVSESTAVPRYVKKGLSELATISVRDEKSSKIVNKILNKTAKIVLDPTLLWDFQNDPNIPCPLLSDYIVVYGSSFTKKMIQDAKKYAKLNRLKLVCINSLDDNFDWCDLVINQDELTPFEWVSYFKHANIVMTCTYHGLMFSLIFKKKIIFYMTDFIFSKSESLIKYLGLKEVLSNELDFQGKINWNWDYDLIYKKLNSMKLNSFDFLNSIIIEN